MMFTLATYAEESMKIKQKLTNIRMRFNPMLFIRLISININYVPNKAHSVIKFLTLNLQQVLKFFKSYISLINFYDFYVGCFSEDRGENFLQELECSALH